MDKKKNLNENLEKQKKYFFQIGMALALSSVLVAFEWVEYDESDTRVCGLPFEITLEEDEIIPITIQVTPPPPPPKHPSSPIIEIVPEITNEVDMDVFETEEMDEIDFDFLEIDEGDELIVEDKVPYIPFPDINAEYVGGELELRKFLSLNLEYPKRLRNMGIEGDVMYEFMVMEDGSISEIKLLLGNNKQLNEDALRVLKLLSNWVPDSHGGRTVRSTMRLPFAYKMVSN